MFDGLKAMRRLAPAAILLGAALALLALEPEAAPQPRQDRLPPRHPAGEAGIAAPEGEVVWLQDEAVWKAAAPKTFRLLYVRSPRDFGCELLERIAFADPEVLAYLKEHAAARYVDLVEQPQVARRYGVSEIPALVVLDPEGGLGGVLHGYRPPMRLKDDLQKLAAQAQARVRRAAELDAQLADQAGAPGEARFEALDAAASLAAERKRFELAVGYLEQFLASPKVEEARSVATLRLRLAQALAEAGRGADAEAQFELAARADTLSIYGEAIGYARAQAALHAGALEASAARWAEFLAKHPKSARRGRALYNRAYALLGSGKPAEAAPPLKELLEAQDLDAETYAAARGLLYASRDADPALAALAAERGEAQTLADALADGRDLAREYSCLDCHKEIEPELKSAHTTCVECHLLLKQFEREPERHDRLLERHTHFYRNCARIRHTLRAPSLAAVGARVQAGWIAAFLDNPYDVRPHLEESMPQMNLSTAQSETLTRYLRAIASASGHRPPDAGEPAAPAHDPALAAKGRELFEQFKCYACHQYGNVRFGDDQASWNWDEGRAEAPNLRFARHRLTARTAADWIRDPQKVDPKTRMPKFELDEAQIDALVQFIFHGDAGAAAAPRAEAEKPLERAPAWEEVNHAIFQDTCVHCHMSDAEGGAGNVGAYGYRARRLDLTSFAGLKRGSLQPDGTRLDILKSAADGSPAPILARVQLRIEENKRDGIKPFEDPLTDLEQPREGRIRPGMPFGHPALTPEQIALLKAWLKAGAPGPKPLPLGDPKPEAP